MSYNAVNISQSQLRTYISNGGMQLYIAMGGWILVCVCLWLGKELKRESVCVFPIHTSREEFGRESDRKSESLLCLLNELHGNAKLFQRETAIFVDICQRPGVKWKREAEEEFLASVPMAFGRTRIYYNQPFSIATYKPFLRTLLRVNKLLCNGIVTIIVEYNCYAY